MVILVRSLARRPVGWLLFMFMLCAAAAWLGTRLQLRADLLSMLPGEVPAAQAYRTFLEEFGGMEQVFVVISKKHDPELLDEQQESLDQRILDAALQLESRLRRDPLIAKVRAGVEPEDERFFLEYVVPRTVLRDPAWTKARVADRLAPTAVAQRVELLRRKLRSPLGELEVRLARYDPLGFAEGLLSVGGDGLALLVEPLSGIFQSESGSALLIIEPTVSELDATAGRSLADALARHFGVVEDAVGAGVAITAVGGPLYAAADEELIRSDLESTISLSIAGCLLVLLLAFGSWRATVVAIAVLATAFSLSFALLAVGRGEMLAVSLGFSAVLIGLGIDYVIHAVTRYRQGLEKGKSPEQSLVLVYQESARALLGSSLTTASAFAVLLASAMRPLVEIGLLVSVGIVAMLVCTVLVGAPLMVLLVRGQRGGRRISPLQLLWKPSAAVPSALLRFARQRPWMVLPLAGLILLVSVWSAKDLRFSPRFEDLRPEDHPLETAERLLATEFSLGEDTATILVHGATMDQALERAGWIAESLTAPSEMLRGVEITVSSPSAVLMSTRRLQMRVEQLSDLDWSAAADELERLMPMAGLSAHGFAPGIAALRSLGRGEEPATGREMPWPDWVGAQLATAEEGRAMVALRVRTNAAGSRWLATSEAVLELQALVAEREGPPTEAKIGSPAVAGDAGSVSIASAFALGEQMRTVGEREVGILAAASLGVVVTVVAVVLGLSPIATALALLPILFGAAVAFGVLAATAGRLDFLSLAIVPMLFGIGIDDGLHALCGGGREVQPGGESGVGSPRARRLARLALVPRRVAHASRALTLTTLTTVVGFGSLGFSSMPGLRNGGLIVAVGVVACWLTTILVLPALVEVLLRRKGAQGPPLDADLAAGGCQKESNQGGSSQEDQAELGQESSTFEASQAPKVSDRWIRRLGFLHFSSPFWYRLHASAMRHLPSWLISAMIMPLVGVFFLLLGNVRQALVSNRRVATGTSRWGLMGDLARGLGTLYQYAWCFCETYEGLFDPATRSLATVVGEENWAKVTGENHPTGSDASSLGTEPEGEAAMEGRGFVIATAHVGHWEVGSHLSKFERPRKVHVVREPEMNPASQAFLESLFAKAGDEHYQVHFARPEDPMLGGRLVSALRRGEIVALQGDRPRAGGRSIAVELFGRPFDLPIGPFAMARAARVPLLPVFVFREGRRRSELHLRDPIVVPRTRDRRQDLAAAARRFAGEVEWAITRRPEQWFCLRTLWPR